MSGTGPTAIALRFTLGFGAAVGAGWLRFGGDVFLPGTRPFQCITIGSLAAGLLALVRGGRPRQALLLVAGFAVLQTGLAATLPWPRMIAQVIALSFAAGGIWLIAFIFDQLAERGLRIGKFLLTGPLLGGVYLAVTPLATAGMVGSRGSLTNLFANLWLGILIGNGVGFGVELAELVPGLSGASRPAGDGAPARAAPESERLGRAPGEAEERR